MQCGIVEQTLEQQKGIRGLKKTYELLIKSVVYLIALHQC